MPVPTHGEDCEVRIWPAKCPDCGDDVYFLSCTCGSKVYLDLPEPPWNPHEERCIPYLIRYLIEQEQVSEPQIRHIVEEYSRSSGIPIPPEIHRRIIAMENKGKGGIVLHKVLPGEEECVVVGQITAVNTQVNFLKRLKYSDNIMGRSLLAKLLKESYVEITIREDPDEETRSSNQFEFYVPLRAFERSQLRHGARAFVVLNPYSIPDGRRIWLCDAIEKE